MEERFNLTPTDIEIVVNDRTILKGEDLKKYLTEKKEKMLTIKERLNIGDIVKLKGFDNQIIIEENDGQDFLYSGVLESDLENSILFNQEDIDEIIKKI